MEGPTIFFTIPLFGGIRIDETIVNAFLITAVIFVFCRVLTYKMEKIPRKKTQIIAEKLVLTIDKLVETTMGGGFMKFSPYIMALFSSSILGSLIGLVGLRPITMDINTTGAWALMTAFFIHYIGFQTNGFRNYMKSFAEPIPFLLPINLIGILSTPVGMALRHFGNIVGGNIIMTLIYTGLASFSSMIRLPVPIFQAGLPAILSLYFDLFSGFMQAFIFCMLTMVYVSNSAPDEVAAG